MKNSLKQRLQEGEKLAACWTSLFDPLAAEIMAAAGYDLAMIDMEHGPGSYLDAIPVMQAVLSQGCQPVIRCSSSGIVDIKRTLDIGPAGIMIPDVRSAAHASEIVAHCRYGPEGDRGAAPGFMRATGYAGFSDRVADYPRYMREDFLLIIQLENPHAIAELDAIVAIEEIDMVFIGPADLSASLGALGDFRSTAFIDAFQTIEARSLAAGKFLGCIPFAEWPATRLYQNGHQLVVSGSDAILLASAARADQEHLRAAAETAA